MLDKIIKPILPQIEAFESRLGEALASDVSLVGAMGRHLLETRGNRIRPTLSLLTAQAIGECDDRVVDAAVGIEIIHTATLIHDDVIDFADKRRGAEVLNIRWGNQAAVLMGDFLLATALQTLVGLDSMPVMRAATAAVRRMIEGEILETEKGADAETAVYYQMIDKKTASLMALCCEVGAILAGGTADQIRMMAAFGKDVGMAFQITDDLLDFVGDEDAMGKPVGKDVRERKVTLPLLRALANCQNGEAEKIQKKVRNGVVSNEDVDEIMDFVRRYRGIDEAKDEARSFADAGLGQLDGLGPSVARDAIELTVRHVMDRQR
jgi:octaprenyl-diphosphate synthase